MSRTLIISIVCACNLFSGLIFAAEDPQPCKSLKQVDNLNLTRLLGKWYEQNRTDYEESPTFNGQCVVQDYHKHGEKYMVHTSLKYIEDKKIKQEIETTADIESKNDFLNVTYLSKKSLTMKVLETDYENYAIVCAYVNDTVDAGAWILSRERILKPEYSTSVETNATKICSDFSKAKKIEQGDVCNHSSILIPAITMIFTSLYISFKNIPIF